MQLAECVWQSFCLFSLPVVEHSVYILCLLLPLPLRKTSQQFIVKRLWQQELLVQEHYLLLGEIRYRSEPRIQTIQTQLLKNTTSTTSYL